MSENPVNLNVNRGINIELINLQNGGDVKVEQNSFPAVVTNRALEKIKSGVFGMATATTAPVKRTVTLLDKIEKFFSDLFTAIKNKFSGSFNGTAMTRNFNKIFDDLQVRLIMADKEEFGNISGEIKSLKVEIKSIQESNEFKNLCNYYDENKSTRYELYKAFTGSSPEQDEEPPEQHPLKKYLTTVIKSLDNLNKIRKAVGTAYDFSCKKENLKIQLAEAKKSDNKQKIEETERALKALNAKKKGIAVELFQNHRNEIYGYDGDSIHRRCSNGSMHEDLYGYLNELFCKLLKIRSGGIENYSFENGKLTLVKSHY